MISEGSCDTEDWSNDAENLGYKLHFTIYSHKKQLFYIGIIFQNLYCIFTVGRNIGDIYSFLHCL